MTSDGLREEGRIVVGDWVAFCLSCGAQQRWLQAFEDGPDRCARGGELRRCVSCDAPLSSVATGVGEWCGAAFRPNELFGSRIRRA